jgi:hypothetical protein
MVEIESELLTAPTAQDRAAAIYWGKYKTEEAAKNPERRANIPKSERRMG